MASPSRATARREAKPNPTAPTSMLKKKGTIWVVLSEKTGREFGTYTTKDAAKKRLRQMEMFKHLKKKR